MKIIKEVNAYNYMETMQSVLADRSRSKIKFIIIGRVVISWAGKRVENSFCPDTKSCAECSKR